jgi:spermidine/putrescine transport system ATP-binding protein
MPGSLIVDNVSKSYGDTIVLDSVSLQVNQGEFFSLLGPSGCGKSTLLRVIAGFEKPDVGRIILDGKDITNLPPNKRSINTVFQNYALFPHLTVWENVAFGLRVAKQPASYIDQEVEKMLRLFQMEEFAHRKPDNISGGQKQRVAIARALINKPRLLLLDEPLAALDLKLRQKMLMEIDLIHDEVGISFLYVTHDQSEAMAVSDRIAVMHRKKIEQIGTPIEVYESPQSSFVAAFIGDTNFFDGIVAQKVSDEYSLLKVEGLPDLVCYNDKKLAVGDLVHLSVRPEKIHITREKPEKVSYVNLLPGVVDEIIYKGEDSKYWVKVDDYKIAAVQHHSRFFIDENPINWKEPVWIRWHANDGFLLERYSASDENLTDLPPEKVGEAKTLELEEKGDASI